MEGKLIKLFSVKEECVSRHIVYQAVLLKIIHAQLPPRSGSSTTIQDTYKQYKTQHNK